MDQNNYKKLQSTNQNAITNEAQQEKSSQAQNRQQIFQPYFYPQMPNSNQQMNQNKSNQQQPYPFFQNQIPPPPYHPSQKQQPLQFNCPLTFNPNHPRYKYIKWQAGIQCRQCHYRGGDVKYAVGGATIGWGALLFVFCGGILFFWIPCALSQCKDIQVYCSQCGILKNVLARPFFGW